MEKKADKIWIHPDYYKVLDSKWDAGYYNVCHLSIDSLINCITFYFDYLDYHKIFSIFNNQQITQW